MPDDTKLLKIISGGQTGVDRAALDAALNAGLPCGGWCPEGRKAEDGAIPERYPVVELRGAGYRQRTLRNLRDADGTVIFYQAPLEGGSLTTVQGCERARKPCLLLDIGSSACQDDPALAATLLRQFIQQHGIHILNVAGPRKSGCPAAAEFAYRTLCDVLR